MRKIESPKTTIEINNNKQEKTDYNHEKINKNISHIKELKLKEKKLSPDEIKKY